MELHFHSSAVILQNKKVLVVREKNQKLFLMPGGGREANETPEECLSRELKEELNIDVKQSGLQLIGQFNGPTRGRKYQIQTTTFIVTGWQGNLATSGEIEELRFIDSKDLPTINLGLMVNKQIIPKLLEMGLIE